MSEAPKFTKGPWDADIEDVSETFKHRAVIGPNGELVADCDGHRMSGEETAANTLLIAAAPDMLAALTALIDWDDATLGDFIPTNLSKKLRAAISRANGGNQP